MADFESFLDTQGELDAVNDILGAIGEAPMNSLDASSSDVANARRILAATNRTVQAKGWTFNIEESATIMPDSQTGQIPYLQSYLRVMGAGGQGQYINRRGYVFDRTGNTDEFDGPIQVDLVRLRGFYEMPVCFRDLIVCKASRQFNRNFYGQQEIEQALAEQERDYMITCNEYEMDYGRYNMLDGDAFTGGLLSR